MVTRQEIISYLEAKLDLTRFEDSSLNGLQIEGSPEVTKLAVAVDASYELVTAAKDCGANFVLVHHGLFWQKVLPITGPLKKTVETCFQAGINLFAAHLPLDANEELGNNFGLARDLQLEKLEAAFEYRGHVIGCIGENLASLPLDAFTHYLEKLPGTHAALTSRSAAASSGRVLALPFGPQTPRRVGVVSGAGADALEGWEKYGIDTLITGEPRQWVYHFAKERRLNVLFGGHYATETVGVINVAKAVSEQFSLAWEFIDIPTGI